MENKKNDWFATLLFQPNMTLQDFANNDITPDNTSINTREYYKNIPEVIDALKMRMDNLMKINLIVSIRVP